MLRKRRFLLLLGVAAASQLMGAAGIEIVPPVDKRIYHEPRAGITVKIHDRNITRIELVSGRNERYNVELTRECDNMCSATVVLHPGENTIRAWGYVGDRLAYEDRSELYHVSEVFKGSKDPPLKYKEKPFHTAENEKGCAECHDMSSNEQKGIAFVDVRESNCYMCHKQIAEDRYAHAPTVNWLCTGCHTGKPGPKNDPGGAKSKFVAPEPIAQTCYTCHDKNKALWQSKALRHMPVEAGRCTKCHNPHAADNSVFLRETSKALCLECHGDKRLSSAMRGGSKCSGGEAPSCLKCHNPHASDHTFFLETPRTHAIDGQTNPQENRRKP